MPQIIYESRKIHGLDPVFAIVVDYYTLLRMFRSFENTNWKQDRGPVHCRNTPQQDNIILFAGQYHTDRIKHVLDKISILTSNENGCVYSNPPTTNALVSGALVSGATMFTDSLTRYTPTFFPSRFKDTTQGLNTYLHSGHWKADGKLYKKMVSFDTNNQQFRNFNEIIDDFSAAKPVEVVWT